MSNEINPQDLINVRERFLLPKKSLIPPTDPIISKIVGKTVLAQDPRLLKLIVKWKKGKSEDDTEPDNFLRNPAFIQELKQTFN